MGLRSESAINDNGAIFVEIFAIAVELMIGTVAIIALCTQRYDRTEKLNISFAKDLRRMSITAPGPPQMTQHQFHRKLIRHARYALLFQWIAYLICHVLILSHEFLTEPDIIDHLIYFTFLVQLTLLLLTFRNIGIYYFWPFTDTKNFQSPLISRDRDEQKAEFEEIDVDGDTETQLGSKSDDSSKTPVTIDPLVPPHENSPRLESPLMTAVVDDGDMNDPVLSELDDLGDGKSEDEEERDGQRPTRATAPSRSTRKKSPRHHDGRRYSHHHYQDEDFMPDPAVLGRSSGDSDWDEYNRERIRVRINMVHLFRCVAYTAIIYWVGYGVAVVRDSNDMVLGTMTLASIMFAILVSGHMYLVQTLMKLFRKYATIFGGEDEQSDSTREERLFELHRFWLADIAILVTLLVKGLVVILSITGGETKFSWPSSHPIFLATTFAITAGCQMTICRYIWITKRD